MNKSSSPSIILDKNLPRFIDDYFPIVEVSEAAIKEKSVRHGHLSTLQQWWARRPLSTARSAIFLALCPSEQEISSSIFMSSLESLYPECKTLSEKIYALAVSLAQTNERENENVYEVARGLLRLNREDIPKVLDTFAGGGSFPVEALRLGLDSLCSDLNPVATTALRAAIELLPTASNEVIDKYIASAKRISSNLEKAVSHLYNAPEEQSLAYFWCRTYECPSCDIQVPLLRNHWLAKGKRNVAVKLIHNSAENCLRFEIYHPENEAETDLADSGNINQKGARCPACSHIVSTAWLRSNTENGQLGERLYAKLIKTPERKYIICSIEDQNLARINRNDLRNNFSNRFPDIALDMNGIRHTWAMQYGIRNSKDLYNERQYTSLSILIEIINKEKVKFYDECEDDAARLLTILLTLTFNRLISYGTRHSWWQSNGEFPASMFGRQGIAMVWNYVEIPPISKDASGWTSSCNWITKVIKELSSLPKSGKVWLGDASVTNLQDKSIDLITLDPPYYDTIAYGYLSDIFYVWMREILFDVLPEDFSHSVTQKSEEAIVDRKHSLAPSPKDSRHFHKKMLESFLEARRVIKPDGRMLLMFGHKNLDAWIVFLDALLDSGFQPISSWPIHTERKSKFKHNWVDALSTSCLIVCTPTIKKDQEIIELDDFNLLLKDILDTEIRHLKSVGIDGSDLASSLIVPAYQLFSEYQVKIEGVTVSADKVLGNLQEIIKERELVFLENRDLFSSHENIKIAIRFLKRRKILNQSGLTNLDVDWRSIKGKDVLMNAADDYLKALKSGIPSQADKIYDKLSLDEKRLFEEFILLISLLSDYDSIDKKLSSGAIGRLRQNSPIRRIQKH